VRETLYPGDDAENKTDYIDIIAKVNSAINVKNHLYLTYYRGKDRIKAELEEHDEDNGEEFETSTETNLEWGNEIISLRWQSLIAPSVFLNTIVSSNNYFSDLSALFLQDQTQGNFSDPDDLFYASIASVNQDIEIKSELDLSPSSNFRLKTGLGYLRRSFMPDFQVITEESEGIEDIDNFNIGILDKLQEAKTFNADKWFQYTEASFSIHPWTFVLGLRNTYFKFDEASFFHPQPRLTVDYSFSPTSVLSASVSKAVQYVHLLSSSEVNLPRDLWFPADDGLPPEESWQYNLSLKKALSSAVEVNTEIYYKNIQNKTASLEIAYDENAELQDLFSTLGKANSYGFEVLTNINQGRWESSISYSLSKSTLTIPELNQGNSFDFQFDRRYEWKTINTFQISKDFVLGLSTYLGSGHPFLVTTEFDLDTGLNPVDINAPGQRNTQRTGLQHRVDISLLYSKRTGPLFHNLKINIYNAYNQNLPLFHTLKQENNFERLTPNFSIPIIPSLSYSLRF
jgi:hypothetical protein